jgi:PTS system nitrogen regulatory IIA component
MVSLQHILDPERTRCGVRASSKKAIFEGVAELVTAADPALDTADIIGNLLAREKLGSTGLGGGIAIPHCRLPACQQPLGVLMTLALPADFDAPDERPVDLLFVLLVPEEACQEHLDLLAAVARLFSQEPVRQALRACDSDRDLYDTVLEWAD